MSNRNRTRNTQHTPLVSGARAIEILEARLLLRAVTPRDVLPSVAMAGQLSVGDELAPDVPRVAAAGKDTFASLSRGTLRVHGTSGPDRVSLASATAPRPDGGVDNFLDVRLNDAVRRFPLQQIRRIVVQAGRGNDQVDASEAAMGRPDPRSPMKMNGGPGNDTIIGGPTPDRISGGPGDDVIFARVDQNSDLVLGGPGHDTAELNPADATGLRGDRARGVEVAMLA